MGGRPYPSTLEVTRTRPRREEWPCPGSRGRHPSWRQRSAQCNAARQSRQRHTPKLASTRQHAAHNIAEQRKAVYHNNGGGQPHHPPQAPAPAQHPTRPGWGPDPPHGHFTHTQPPPPANKAHTQTSKAGPGGSDSAPPMGGRPYPSASEVTRTQPRRGERPCPGSRGVLCAVCCRVLASFIVCLCRLWRAVLCCVLCCLRVVRYAASVRRGGQSSVPQQQRRTATPPAASTNTSPTPNAPTHSHPRPQTRHARGESPKAHSPTPQRPHGAHHTRNNQGHTYTQHRRDASLMYSREPSPSLPHWEKRATQT